MTDSPDRHNRGLDVMSRIHGQAATRQILDNFNTLSPDYADYVLEAGFADIYSRPGLDLTQRQLINIAIFTTLGDTTDQLATHIRGALHVGVTPDRVVETIIHTSLYAGHPRAGTALATAHRVLSDAAQSATEENSHDRIPVCQR